MWNNKKSVFGSKSSQSMPSTGGTGGLPKSKGGDLLQPGLYAGPQQGNGGQPAQGPKPGQANIPKSFGKKLGVSIFGKPKISPGSLVK